MRQKILSLIIIIFTSLTTIQAKDKKDTELQKFESAAWELRTDLVHNHTYDIANLKKADSLYKKSEEMNSILGKLYALQIRTYALVGNDMKEEFLKTVNEYIHLALDNKRYDEYFDAASAKTQYLMGTKEYTKSLFEAKDMVATAERINNLNGLYESNLLLGQIYKYRCSWSTAEKHLNKSLEAIHRLGDNDSIPYCLIYRELAECYSGAGRHDLALQYAAKAKQWAPFDVYRYFSEWTYLSALYNKGDMDKFKKAYYKSALNTKKAKDMLPEEMAVPLEAMICVAQGQYDKARHLMDKISDEKDTHYDTYAGIYYREGNYKLAYEYIVKQQNKMDSIETLLQHDELSEMEARLGTATLRVETREAKLKQRQTMLISIGTMFLFIICTMIYMLQRRRNQNKILSEINKSIEQKNTELLQAQETIKQALDKAEQANAMRSHFIENMMHEFRTPLNAIVGFTQILTNPEMETNEEEAKEMCDIIMSNTDSLTTMLNQIIHLSSFDSGSEEIEIEETSLNDIINNSIAQCNNIKDGVKLIVKTEDTTLYTDKSLAIEALTSLLLNAGKFTEEGSITVESGTRGNDIYMSVTDTGIGVEHDYAEKIFDRFYKVDYFVPGTGLGLSLCRAIVTTLGGTVIMDTSYQEPGCRFTITLPKALK